VPKGIRKWFALSEQIRQEIKPQVDGFQAEISRLQGEVNADHRNGPCDGSCRPKERRIREIKKQYGALVAKLDQVTNTFENLVRLEFGIDNETEFRVRKDWKIVVQKKHPLQEALERIGLDELFGGGLFGPGGDEDLIFENGVPPGILFGGEPGEGGLRDMLSGAGKEGVAELKKLLASKIGGTIDADGAIVINGEGGFGSFLSGLTGGKGLPRIGIVLGKRPSRPAAETASGGPSGNAG
jgi:tellurite resistance protein